MKNIDASYTRKQFLIGSSAAAIGLFCGRALLHAQPASSPALSATPESADNVPDFPEHHAQFDRARVKRFVIAGHVNPAAMKAMLAEEPHLINGAIDWGDGDFETALGGASHMGRRDIAEYLLEHNARMDIFAATMLGQIDIVKAAVAAFPNIRACARTSRNPIDRARRERWANSESRVGISKTACRSTETRTMNTRLLVAIILVSLSVIRVTRANDIAKQVAPIVAQIQRGDYEGDRAAMQRGYDDLKPFTGDKELASRVRYWRGFAQWRRAINGFNDSVDPKELEQNLKTAVEEFKISMEKDPTFVDAKIGTISCLGYLAFMNRKDQARAKELVGQMLPLVKEATDVAPDNPRLIWVRGPIFWNTPPERGGGQDKAIENYQHGLKVCSKIKLSDDPLEPSWGKPELMMNLAYCYLNANKPDVNAAERNARAALEIVPYWHYVRDILLPQIVAAKAKAQ